jgi:hypothetical protein
LKVDSRIAPAVERLAGNPDQLGDPVERNACLRGLGNSIDDVLRVFVDFALQLATPFS